MKKQDKGFIHIIIIAILLIIIISLLGVSLQSIFANTLLQDNFRVVGDWLSWLWNSTILSPVKYVFDLLIVPAWQRLLTSLQSISF